VVIVQKGGGKTEAEVVDLFCGPFEERESFGLSVSFRRKLRGGLKEASDEAGKRKKGTALRKTRGRREVPQASEKLQVQDLTCQPRTEQEKGQCLIFGSIQRHQHREVRNRGLRSRR